MDITSIKEKYLIDINKNYVPKTAVEARLGRTSQKSVIAEKKAQLRYRTALASIKKRYDEAIRYAKEEYDRNLKTAKELLKGDRKEIYAGYNIREWNSFANGPRTPNGLKLAPTARLASKNSKRINKERYT